MRITDGYQNMFRIPELKQKLLFTAFILIIYRFGSHVPVPGVDTSALAGFFEAQRGTLLGLYDMFAGGNLSKAAKLLGLPRGTLRNRMEALGIG